MQDRPTDLHAELDDLRQRTVRVEQQIAECTEALIQVFWERCPPLRKVSRVTLSRDTMQSWLAAVRGEAHEDQ